MTAHWILRANRYLRKRRHGIGRIFFGLLGAGLLATGAMADTLYVSPAGTNNSGDKYPDWAGAANTISAAVARATGGDTILATNATYVLSAYVNIGTNISVISTNGSGDGERAVLDGDRKVRGFYIHHTGAVIRGFAVIRGLAPGNDSPAGAGGYVAGGTVEDCIISNCYATNNPGRAQGGGLYVNTGTIRDCVIVRNTGGDGAGMFINNALVERCTINSNPVIKSGSYAYGGGIYAVASTVRDCDVIGNGTPLYAGGAYLSGSVMERCMVARQAASTAGGVYVLGGSVISDSTISGNTGYGGTGYGGGGMRVDSGTVSNCLITGNLTETSPATYSGGGAWLASGAALLVGCVIVNNTSGVTGSYGKGGGIYMTAGTVSNCLIISNLSFRGGGSNGGSGQGVWMSGGVVRNSTISYNVTSQPGSTWGGGGVYMTGGLLLNCTVVSNAVGQYGGGAYVGGIGIVSNCIIKGNYTGTGGGVYMAGSVTNRLCNSLINNNRSSGSGGGVYLAVGAMESCTVAGNLASADGGGVYRSGGTVTNAIIYGNSAANSTKNIYGADDMLFGYCCTTGLTHAVNGNITNTPLFVDAGSDYGTNGVPGDYRLSPRSPCVDVGTNVDWMADAQDLEDHRRIVNLRVDIGAYEFMAKNTLFLFR